MKKYDVVIVGSGLGGLECGYILSKKGYSVCILEKNPQIGGCLQTFNRGGITYDTGFHYVGGLDEGQPLHKLFRYFDLLDLPWHKMDENGFAEVVFGDNSYLLASGYERFIDTLTKHFPSQHEALKAYTHCLKATGKTIEQKFNPNNNEEDISTMLLEQSAYGFLEQTISDPLLRNVLSGASMTMELCKEKLPLYVFSQINNSFIQSAWRLNGGGQLIADRLAENIRRMGGDIITKAHVNQLIEQNGEITAVEYNGSEQIACKQVISNLHPAATLSLIPQSKCIRPIFRKRIVNIPNTFGVFTTHLHLKPDSVAYLNRNIFIHQDNDPWNVRYQPDDKTKKILISYQMPQSGNPYTQNIDILTPMHWEQVRRWEDTTIGRRGENYLEFKARKAEECIMLASERIPELKGDIEKIHTSTPLTYRDYTSTWQGSAYGIQKDYNNVMQTLLTPQTPVSNLFLTGQNLNLHGILGVTMTSFFTCAKITGSMQLD